MDPFSSWLLRLRRWLLSRTREAKDRLLFFRGKEEEDDVIASFKEWLLLIRTNSYSNNYEHYSLLNTSTSESISLPSLKLSSNQFIRYSVLFLSDDDDNGSRRKVLTLLLFESTNPCIFYFQLSLDGRDGDGGDDIAGGNWIWRSIPYADESKAYYNQNKEDFENKPPCWEGYRLRLGHPVYCQGKLYALTHNETKLVEVEINMDNSNSLVIKSLGCDMPQMVMRCYNSLRKLVEYQGILLWIVVAFGGIDNKEVIAISIFKLNFSTWNWAKVDSLEDGTLFLSPGTEANFRLNIYKRVGGNCVYFVRDEEIVYCYNMEDNSVSMFLPWTSSLIPANTNHNNIENCVMEGMSKEVCINICDLPSGLEEKEEMAAYFSSGCAWLVVPGNKTNCDKDTWRFHNPYIIGGKYLITMPALLKDVTIRCSKDGWLLLSCSENQRTFLFFNPFTKAMIPLPYFDHVKSMPLVGFAFSSSPTSDDCIVVAISWVTHMAWISIFASGMDHWDFVSFENNFDFTPSFNNPVFWNGSTYFLGEDGNLGVLKIHGFGNYEWEVLDKPKRPCDSFSQNFLVECGGDLLSVFVGSMGRSVDVFKLSLLKSAWEKVECLGNYVLHVSRFSSFATLARSQKMQNRIYFTRFHGESLVYFSLDTGKFHSVGSKDSFTDYVGTREQLLCGWIEPKASSLLLHF